jgi:cysteine desulfurase/selenocysteine lyase
MTSSSVHASRAEPSPQEFPAGAPLNASEVARIRDDFPILSTDMNGHALIYLDSGATSQKPAAVIAVEREFYEGENAAVHRGANTLAALATERFEDARATLARFVGARDDEIVWTSNATEAINLVAYAIGNATLGRGGEAARQSTTTECYEWMPPPTLFRRAPAYSLSPTSLM